MLFEEGALFGGERWQLVRCDGLNIIFKAPFVPLWMHVIVKNIME